MVAVIAVHCGAGTHKSKYHSQYNKLCKKACRKGISILQSGGTALEAVTAVITILENDPITNCGYGSNLTNEGTVETDASIMDGETLSFGGCGAVTSVKNPITLAHNICIKQSEALPLGLVSPSLLVGRGALNYAKAAGLKVVGKKALISSKALSQYEKYKRKLHSVTRKNELLDTVGAVCIDKRGHVAAGCSSGGILLKRPGRIGQGAVYSSGVWADSFSSKNKAFVAVCTSGCGEHLIKTQLAKEVAEDIIDSTCPTVGLNNSVTNKFLNSRYLQNVNTKLCGALVLHYNPKTKDISIIWGHTTETMSIGYMRTNDEKPTAMVSELPQGVYVGTKVNVSGAYSFNPA